jgi:hypothetical protein
VVAGAPARAAGCANERVREEQVHGVGLPDCRAYEQVTPLEKEGVDAKGFAGDVQAAPDGQRVRFWTQIPFPDACGGSGGEKYISSLVGEAWITEGVLPCDCPESDVRGFSEDLAETVLWCEGAALTPNASASERGYYVRETASGKLRLLVSMTGAVEEQNYFTLAGFSGDDKHLIFESAEHLLPQARIGEYNLYEVNLEKPEPEQLSLVGQTPKSGESCTAEACEAPPQGSVAGAGAFPWAPLHSAHEHYTQSTISTGGQRVFFMAVPSERLYVRENETTTVAVSKGTAHFWWASPEGQYVLYTEGEDLYRYDLETTHTEPITTASAGVLGLVDSSNDAHTIYFTATSILATNKNPYGEHAGVKNEYSEEELPASEVANLYEWHQPETGPPTTTFISTLVNSEVGTRLGDEGDWLDNTAVGVFPNNFKTSRVTPDGQTLLFSSHLPLTGYDSGKQAKLYRYSAGAEGAFGSLICVSCNPTGAPTKDQALLAGQAGGAEPFPERALTHNLSENGQRIVFATSESLTGTATTAENVYEWEADGEGSCRSEAQDDGCLYLISSGTTDEPSYLLDASADGDDIFFFTRQQLVPTDTDNNVDVYDACVDCAVTTTIEHAQPECTPGEACHKPTTTPALATPASTTLTGNHNLTPQPKPTTKPLTPAEREAKELKACRAKHNKHKRKRCETTARKRYHTATTSTKRATKR